MKARSCVGYHVKLSKVAMKIAVKYNLFAMQDMGHTGSELERLGMGTNQRCSSGSVVQNLRQAKLYKTRFNLRFNFLLFNNNNNLILIIIFFLCNSYFP